MEYVGQIIGVTVATDQAIAKKAAKQVVVEYEDLPPIISMEEAIAAKSFFTFDPKISSGDTAKALTSSDHMIEGEMRTGAQEHFYLETQAVIAIPKGEHGEMEIIASTQNPTKTQMVVAHVLGVPANRIVCKVKRMGGGFGGKETRNVPLCGVAAVAANEVRLDPVYTIRFSFHNRLGMGIWYEIFLFTRYRFHLISEWGFVYTRNGNPSSCAAEDIPLFYHPLGSAPDE